MRCKKKINLKRLKKFAKREMIGYPFSQELIVSEKDLMNAEEYLIKLDMWLQVLDKELRNKI